MNTTAYTWSIFFGDYLPWLCLALVTVAPLVDGRSKSRADTRAFYGETLLTLFIAELLAQLGKLFEVWPERPGFPSGHTTWATVLMLCLALRDRRWLIVGVPTVVLMCWSLIYSDAHYPRDVLGGLILSVVVTLVIRRAARAFRKARAAEAAESTSPPVPAGTATPM